MRGDGGDSPSCLAPLQRRRIKTSLRMTLNRRRGGADNESLHVLQGRFNKDSHSLLCGRPVADSSRAVIIIGLSGMPLQEPATGGRRLMTRFVSVGRRRRFTSKRSVS